MISTHESVLKIKKCFKHQLNIEHSLFHSPLLSGKGAHMSPKYLFCSRLAYIRRDVLGITQEVAAEKMGIDISTYAHFERGETNFSIERLDEFSRACDIDFADLIPSEFLDPKKILGRFTPTELIEVALEKLLRQTKTE